MNFTFLKANFFAAIAITSASSLLLSFITKTNKNSFDRQVTIAGQLMLDKKVKDRYDYVRHSYNRRINKNHLDLFGRSSNSLAVSKNMLSSIDILNVTDLMGIQQDTSKKNIQTITLPQQKIMLKDLIARSDPKKTRVFFQCEFRSLTATSATFGVIAYSAWENAREGWQIGKKVMGKDTEKVKSDTLKLPLAFTNNELLLYTPQAHKDLRQKPASQNKSFKNWDEFYKKLDKIHANEEWFQKCFLLFDARISDNPHIVYDVTLNAGDGTAITVSTNPSPPARPSRL